MSGTDQTAVLAKKQAACFAVGGAVAAVVTPHMAEVGSLEDLQHLQKVIQSGAYTKALWDALHPVLAHAIKGTNKPDCKWPDAAAVFRDFFGIDLNIDLIGPMPPAKNLLTKGLVVPLQKMITLENLIKMLRAHYDIAFDGPHTERIVNEVTRRARKGTDDNQSVYQVRFDESRGDQYETGKLITPTRFFEDINLTAMTLREFLVADLFFWIATGRQDHIDSHLGLTQVLAGNKMGNNSHLTVTTTPRGLTIGTLGVREQDTKLRMRRVAIHPDNVLAA